MHSLEEIPYEVLLKKTTNNSRYHAIFVLILTTYECLNVRVEKMYDLNKNIIKNQKDQRKGIIY